MRWNFLKIRRNVKRKRNNLAYCLCLLNILLPLCQLINIIKMNKGTLKFFNETKGFGFISDEESQKEYFVHVSGLIDEIREGDTVEYELEEGRKGLNAVNVKVA